MRALLSAAAALLLAGCQVDLEGAACAVPGSSDQCPSGQRCGVDQRCSSSPVMTCPAPAGGELVVDPGAPAGAPDPTGARSPPACRFRSLDLALAAAIRGAGKVVRASGAATTYPVTATLVIPAGVTLKGDDDPPAPESRVLSLEGNLAAGVTLAEGATLSGVTVRNGSAAAAAVGVEIACAAGADAAQVIDVKVQAGGATTSLVNGIHAGGACPVELRRVTVQGASGAGLLVARDAASDTLFATGATFDGNGEEGIRITRGDVTLLERSEVSGNAGAGVAVEPLEDRGVLLTIDQGLIRWNGDTGVTVPGKQAGRLRLTSSRVCGNGATTPSGGPYAQRKVGGLYLFGNPPPDLAVEASALFSNAGDQLLVASAASAGTWALDGAASAATACGAGVNLLDGYAPADGGVTYVGLFAASATVTGRWNAWRLNATPVAGTDYAVSGTGSVDAGVPAQFCIWSSPAPTCD